MRKSGLHKQIASIFDGVPERKAGSAVLETETPRPSQSAQPELNPASEAFEVDSPLSRIPKPSEAKPLIQERMAMTPPPATVRPMPVPRNRALSVNRTQGPKLTEQIKKAVLGSAAANPRQKKMAVMAGLLAVVFGGVLFFSLGGVGNSRPAAAKEKPSTEVSDPSGHSASKAPAWTMPEPLPESRRDPMKPGVVNVSGSKVSESASGEFVVKGIVFSQNKPSALINNEIVKEGQVFNGAMIVRIDKSEVEFEANGKRWTQPVQR
jgi:hypothetical protein